MIDKETYDEYFDHLINGRKEKCLNTINTFANQKVAVDAIYTELFQRSLYQVGDFWEKNKISVATEHMATAITENMMIRLQPQLFATERTGKKAVIACVANEYHQVGAKMIADMFEMNGWDGFFVGANTPFNELIRFIQSHNPDVIGLSLSIYFNIHELKNTLGQVRTLFPTIPIIIGGQAFRWGGIEITRQFENVQFISSIPALENFINNHN